MQRTRNSQIRSLEGSASADSKRGRSGSGWLVSVLSTIFLRLLVLGLLLVLLIFGAGGDVGVLFGKDADNASGNFVADYSLVVLANDIDSEFLHGDDSKGLKG